MKDIGPNALKVCRTYWQKDCKGCPLHGFCAKPLPRPYTESDMEQYNETLEALATKALEEDRDV